MAIIFCVGCANLLGPHGHNGADATTTFARLLTEALSGKRYEDDFGGVQNPLGITADNLSAPIDGQRPFAKLLPLMYPGVNDSEPDPEHLKRPLLIARVTNFANREILLDGSHRLNYWKRKDESPDCLKAVHLHEVTLNGAQLNKLNSFLQK
jgi:hypothetical protein